MELETLIPYAVVEPLTNRSDDSRTQGRERDHPADDLAISKFHTTINAMVPVLNTAKPAIHDGAQNLFRQSLKRSFDCRLAIPRQRPGFSHRALSVS